MPAKTNLYICIKVTKLRVKYANTGMVTCYAGAGKINHHMDDKWYFSTYINANAILFGN